VRISLATWNLNNRVGHVRFRPDAARAAVALEADVIVFTEYFPQKHDQEFRNVLTASGWTSQLISHECDEKANRVLIVSRSPVVPFSLDLPAFDLQFPANIMAASHPASGLRILGIRVPAYGAKGRALLIKSWEWLENTAAHLRGTPAVILGDLNVQTSTRNASGGAHFRRILENGWTRAVPAEGHSYYGTRGGHAEIDHVLLTECCMFQSAKYVTSTGGYTLAGKPDALSDHAALVADVDVSPSQAS